jgi:hypothetical protein
MKKNTNMKNKGYHNFVVAWNSSSFGILILEDCEFYTLLKNSFP